MFLDIKLNVLYYNEVASDLNNLHALCVEKLTKTCFLAIMKL